MYPSPALPSRVQHFNRGWGYAVAGNSGTIAAALAANSVVFSLLCDPQVGVANPNQRLSMYYDRLRFAFTTITAFGTSVTAPRQLGVYRAAGAAATGGTAIGVVKKDTKNPNTSVCTDARIAAAAALGFTAAREANPLAMMDLVHVGAAGARQDFLYELAAPMNNPIAINPGELLVVSNPAVFDAGGTWQLSVDECNWIEAIRDAVE